MEDLKRFKTLVLGLYGISILTAFFALSSLKDTISQIVYLLISVVSMLIGIYASYIKLNKMKTKELILYIIVGGFIAMNLLVVVVLLATS